MFNSKRFVFIIALLFLVMPQTNLQSATVGLSSDSTIKASCPKLAGNMWLGIRGVEVSALQTFLRSTKDFTYPDITTFYGNVTASAVRKFQCREMSLCSGTPATTGYGVTGPATRAAIANVCVEPTITDVIPTTTNGIILTRNLWPGLRGDDVYKLQQYLKNTGDFTYPTITGYYGNVTVQAVRRYQCRTLAICSGSIDTNGYGATGPKTRTSLIVNRGGTTVLPTPVPTPTPTPIPTPTPTPVPVPVPTPTPTPVPVVTPSSCSLDGKTLASGTSAIFYNETTTAQPDSCDAHKLVRKCNNGLLSGDDLYKFNTCITSTLNTPSCSISISNTEVNKGTDIYMSWISSNTTSALLTNNLGLSIAVPPMGGRTSNTTEVPIGIISYILTVKNSYDVSAQCTDAVTVVATPTTPTPTPSSCMFNDVVVGNGTSITAYESSSVPQGSLCVSQERACSDGVLSGAYINASCSVELPAYQKDADGCLMVESVPLTEVKSFNSKSIQDMQTYINERAIIRDASCYIVSGSGSTNEQKRRLQMGAWFSSLKSRWLYIDGEVSVDRHILISNNTKIRGKSGTNARVTAVSTGNIPRIFLVDSGVSNVRFEDLTVEESAQVTRGLIELRGNNSNVILDSIRFVGKNVTSTSNIASGLFISGAWADAIAVRNSYFTGMQYGVQATGAVRNIKVNFNEFEQWTHNAIRIVPGYFSDDNAEHADVQVSQNKFYNPAPGNKALNVILISRGAVRRQYLKNVRITNNEIVGPELPAIFGSTTNANALGDTIVLHGADGFNVSDNTISGGGEMGISVTRMSKNGTIARNTLFRNDAFGMVVGSGYYEVTVDDPSKFNSGDSVVGATSGAIGVVYKTFGNVVAFSTVLGGAIFRPGESINNTTTGITSIAIVQSIDRTKYINVLDNIIYDNGLNKAGEAIGLAGAFVQNSDNIFFKRNHIYNTQTTHTQIYSIKLANSRDVHVDNTNIFEKGAQTISEGVRLTGQSNLLTE